MAVTISDVANEAGVSKSTVSKVLNHWSTISPATVAKVEEAIEKLHYTPNSRAVSFAKQTTNNIVYLTNLAKDSAYENPHMFDIMCGVQYSLAKKGYSLSLVDISDESYPGEKVSQVITSKCCDGLIIHGSATDHENAEQLINESFPHIIIGHPNVDSALCWIDTNHALAGEYAANHMLTCGYTNVAFIGGQKTDYISAQRLKGFTQHMAYKGMRVPSSYIGFTDSNHKNSYEVMLNLIDTIPHLQGVVCEDNTIAVGVVKAIHERGLHIPNDIAVLTFDIYPYSKMIDPKLTIININVYDMGVQAGQHLIRKLKNPELLIQSYTTLPELIQGDSTIPLDS